MPEEGMLLCNATDRFKPLIHPKGGRRLGRQINHMKDWNL